MDCDAYRDQMLDLLYGEGGEPARRAVEEHHAGCDSCREEMTAFRRLRRDLSAWKVPAPARHRPHLPVTWPGLAAAAALVLAVGGVALGGAELRRDQHGFSVRLGRGAAELQARLDQQEARHRAEMTQLRARLEGRPQAGDPAALLSSLRTMVEESERRQQERLQVALLDLSDRYEAQRRYDLAQVSAGMSYLEGKAGLHAARTTELVGQVLLASQEK
jgi:hypothetical protein